MRPCVCVLPVTRVDYTSVTVRNQPSVTNPVGMATRLRRKHGYAVVTSTQRLCNCPHQPSQCSPSNSPSSLQGGVEPTILELFCLGARQRITCRPA